MCCCVTGAAVTDDATGVTDASGVTKASGLPKVGMSSP
jgi:hypothetical protein